MAGSAEVANWHAHGQHGQNGDEGAEAVPPVLIMAILSYLGFPSRLTVSCFLNYVYRVLSAPHSPASCICIPIPVPEGRKERASSKLNWQPP